MNLEQYCLSILNSWESPDIEEFMVAFVDFDDKKLDDLIPEMKDKSTYQKMITYYKLFAIISNVIQEKEDSKCL